MLASLIGWLTLQISITTKQNERPKNSNRSTKQKELKKNKGWK